MSRSVSGSNKAGTGPPAGGAGGALPEAPPCPFCDGGETELVSAFGSHASVATYWCRRCRSPFEVLKWRGADERGPVVRDGGEQ